MAPKKLNKSAQTQRSTGTRYFGATKRLAKALLLFALAASTSTISQLSLAPVYGSIPSGINHSEALIASFTAAYLARLSIPQYDGVVARYLPLWTTSMFVLSYLPFQFSEQLGLVGGPIVSGFLGCHLVLIPTVYVAASALEACIEDGDYPRSIYRITEGFIVFWYFEYLISTLSSRLPDLMTLWPHLNPFNLQVLTCLSLTLLLPQSSNVFLVAVITTNLLALLMPYGSGPYSTPLLQASLNSQNWTLLDRHWSTTGYLSVLQNNDLHYRVLRCDHSLLGGEWQLTPTRQREGWHVSESIYAVFQMLEAVRLLEQPSYPAIPDTSASALVIGLGIGTAPKALLAHGITTTILELDPLVHVYATKYFDLPTNHTAHLTNAITWVQAKATPPPTHEKPQYDYILHDVFTGGAEPLPLFTTAFLRNLRSLLTPHGVAALNYAGDLSLPLTGRVLNTIDTVFDGQCALYRDAPASAEKADEEAAPSDFSNFVVFCTNAPAPAGEGITFRKPRQADWLGSYSRKSHLYPRPELEVKFPLRGGERAGEVLEERDVGRWRRQQEESAGRHWGIMRKVVPSRVWEMY